jgi:hypothetical protein
MSVHINGGWAIPNGIMLFFSDELDFASANDPAGYSIQAPAGYTIARVDFNSTDDAVFIVPTQAFNVGDVVVIEADIATSKNPRKTLTAKFAAVVGDQKARDHLKAPVASTLEDAVAYPLLTEQVGYAPAPASRQSTPGGGGGTSSLQQIVSKAVNDVLGWKVKQNDAKGFVGALTASFTGQDVEGHTEWKWTPRTYAVQTDLSGGITGAQASLYTRAQKALEQSLPLIEGLYPLDPEADQEDIVALKTLVKSQFTSLVEELALAGGPRRARVDQYFILLLNPTGFPNSSSVESDPDKIGGTLGQMRDEFALSFANSEYLNDVEDEQDLSNFRILADYVTSLAQSWLSNRQFFDPNGEQRFLGTQLVLLSRQLSVVSESVDEVRFTLDSVFIGPAERQTLKLNFGAGAQTDALYIEDFLSWVQNFASTEGPQLVQDGGKLAVANSFLPIATKLSGLAKAALRRRPNSHLPHGFFTARVQRSLQQLALDLQALVTLGDPIQRQPAIEPPPSKLRILTQTRLVAIPTTVNLDKNGGGSLASVMANDGTITLVNFGPTPITGLTYAASDPDLTFSPAPPTELNPGEAKSLSWEVEAGIDTPLSCRISSTDDPAVSVTVNFV